MRYRPRPKRRNPGSPVVSGRYCTLDESHPALSARPVAVLEIATAATSEAATSETFTRAFAARKRYDPARGEVRAWLFGIANNLVRRHYRDEERRLRALARLDAPQDDVARDEPRLAHGLATLSREERDVLLLFAWADLEYTEIARVLELPLGTVRSRLHRARAHLRATLEQEEARDG